MQWKGVVAGLIAGIAVSIAWAIWHPRVLPDHEIIFSDFYVTDAPQNAAWDGLAELVGTITGPGQAYPNNTITLQCWHDKMACASGETDQIGDDQIGQVQLLDWIVQTWTPQSLVAYEDGACGRVTIVIDRLTKHVSYVDQRTKTGTDLCQKVELGSFNYTVEDPPAIKAMNARSKQH